MPGLHPRLGSLVDRVVVGGAAGMGVFYSVYYVGCAILPAVAGAVFDATGKATSTLWPAALVALASVATYGAFRFEQKRVRIIQL